jgi:hypothetical protein
MTPDFTATYVVSEPVCDPQEEQHFAHQWATAELRG